MTHYFKDRTGYIVQTQDPTTDPVEFCAQGGGFVCRAPREDFHAMFEPTEFPSTYRAVKVWGDWMDDDATPYDAYTTGERWNGWVVPFFPLASALAIAEQSKVGEGVALVVFDEANDTFIIKHGNGYDGIEDEDEIVRPVWVEINSKSVKKIKTWPVGAWNWCWELYPGSR